MSVSFPAPEGPTTIRKVPLASKEGHPVKHMERGIPVCLMKQGDSVHKNGFCQLAAEVGAQHCKQRLDAHGGGKGTGKGHMEPEKLPNVGIAPGLEVSLLGLRKPRATTTFKVGGPEGCAKGFKDFQGGFVQPPKRSPLSLRTKGKESPKGGHLKGLWKGLETLSQRPEGPAQGPFLRARR